MYTLKFISDRNCSGDGAYQHTVSADSYTVDRRTDDEIIVTAYEGRTTDTRGVEFHVGSKFSRCYVENSQGKTIDKICSSLGERGPLSTDIV